MMSGLPLVKRARTENSSILAAIENCNKLITNMKLSVNQRLTALENRISAITSGCNAIIQRMDGQENQLKGEPEDKRHSCCEEVLQKITKIEESLKLVSLTQVTNAPTEVDGSNMKTNTCSSLSKSPVVLVRNNGPAQVSASVGLDSTMQVITLNNKMDYPEGSWLGDENNPESRVRCAITPENLLHINMFCQTPEKMAVTLLDYLFPREILAVSNLSGKGKHRKKQLDPLMIYGIRCHLLYKFNITERDWYRIKQNMDSKCRTTWKKKIRGLPLGGIKDMFREAASHHLAADDVRNASRNMSCNQSNNTTVSEHFHHVISQDGESLIVTTDSYTGENPIEELETQVLHTSEGDIRVVHATAEQLARLQETHEIQVLREDQILPGSFQDLQEQMMETADSSMALGDQTLTIVTSEDVDRQDIQIEDMEELKPDVINTIKWKNISS